VLSSDPSAARALLAGTMARDGESPLAELTLTGGAFGAAGALAVGPQRLWLALPQLLGGPSVASVPLADVGAASCRARPGLLGGCRVRLEVAGRRVDLVSPAREGEVADFLRVLEAARR
jgi:hypothetical protein